MNIPFITLFERLRPQRRAPTPWLLLRPAVDGWQWCRVPGNQQGEWPAPLEHRNGTRLALVIPAGHCSRFSVAAPPGLKRHEWPLLLEEHLQQPMDQVQVHCLSRTAGHLQLLVVDKSRVHHWLQEAQEQGIDVDALWTEQQLLAPAEPGQTLCWQREADLCLVRGDEHGQQQWLVWPAGLGDPPPPWQGAQSMSGDWPERWAVLEQLPNLLEPGRKRRSVRRPLTPQQRRFGTLAVLLGLCWASLALVQWLAQVPVWKAQVQAVTGPVATVQQAARQVKRLRAEQVEWQIRQEQLTVLEQATGTWLGSQQQWGVSGSYFDGRTWRLVLSGHGTPLPASHWQDLARGSGATASAEPSENGALLTVRFDLGAQP